MKKKTLFITSCLFVYIGAVATIARAGGTFTSTAVPNHYQETNIQKGTFNDRALKGFDPANITCSDSNMDGMIGQNECSWGDTSTPWFPNSSVNTQFGSGVIPGGSSAQLEQSADVTIGEPHFRVKFFNTPSAPDTTSTAGVSSSPSGSLRAQHNEFGFEVVIDKKNDPLEPYYLKFFVPYTTIDSSQDNQGNMAGSATGTYYKEITEMNPMNPGVFNRYTVTGTFTSTGSSYSASSNCDTGCTSDNEWSWRSNWP